MTQKGAVLLSGKRKKTKKKKGSRRRDKIQEKEA